MFSSIFGKKKKSQEPAPAPVPQVQPTASNPVETLKKLQTQIDHINKRNEVLKAQVTQHKKKALALNKSGNRQGALLELKKSKLKDQQLTRNLGIVASIEQTMITVEGSTMTKDAFDSIKGAQTAFKDLMPDVEEVDDVTLDIQEARDRLDEVTGAMAMGGMDFDEDVMAEFDALQEEDLAGPTAEGPAPAAAQAQTQPAAPAPAPAAPQPSTAADEFEELERLAVPSGAPLPQAPTQQLNSEKEEEADPDFAELEGLMSQ